MPPSATNPFVRLTTAQFQDALAQHMDASKPDPLAKGQMEKIRLNWEQCCDGKDDGPIADDGSGPPLRWSQRGTLTLSSDIISIAVNVFCEYKANAKSKNSKSVNEDPSSANQGGIINGNETIVSAEETISNNKRFENEFYIRLKVSASFVSLSDITSSAKEEKLDRKERAMKRKLRTGMIKRLRSDRLVRKILTDEDDSDDSKISSKMKGEILLCTAKQSLNNNENGGILLCEALIQQNDKCDDAGISRSGELEERVNVDEDALEGMRNAIFSRSEDNLDVFDLLLNMPYFPRSPEATADSGGTTTTTTISILADRAYLRLLEDAMFDACEKEGEDDLLDDLNISDAIHDSDGVASEDGKIGSGRGRKAQTVSKRMKPV